MPAAGVGSVGGVKPTAGPGVTATNAGANVKGDPNAGATTEHDPRPDSSGKTATDGPAKNLHTPARALQPQPAAKPGNETGPQPEKSTKDNNGRRDSAPPARLSSERFDPAKTVADQFRGDRKGLQGGQLAGAITQIRYDVRRFEESRGNWVREFTVPLDLTSNSGSVSIDARDRLTADLQSHLDATINHQQYRLPGGDRLQVRVDARATDDLKPDDDRWQFDQSRNVPVNVHDSTVDKDAPPTNQVNWDLHDPRGGLAHEVMHFVGLSEGYHDPRLLFQRPETPGVMGPHAWTDSSLTPQNLNQIEEISTTANIHDHHLGDPGTNHTPTPAPGTHPTPNGDHTPGTGHDQHNGQHTGHPPGTDHDQPTGHTRTESPNLHFPVSAPTRVTVNGSRTVDARPGTVVRRDAFDPDQHTILGVHGLDAVVAGGETPHDNFRQAVIKSLPDNTPRETARITSQLESNPNLTDPGQIAQAGGVRVHVLEPGGGWTSHGPENGRPVHIVQSTVDGKETYLGTRENVHIGRQGVSYPGSTVLGGDRKVVHRGEFEVETVRGEHYVRMYTAVLDPAVRSSDFKDVHQNPDGTVEVFAGRSGQTFWVGGGRPMRAVQWAAKYEHDTNRTGDMQPVLRSFLVPLKTFNQVSREATVEALSKDNSLAVNVDQAGDTNQFGLRGEHFEQMRVNALKGSLVTYAPGGKDYKLPDLAGRREDISDLYVRLGLSPDFDSSALGRENDPWFTWSKDGKYFRNDPGQLRALAKTLGEHYHTWKGSPEAFFNPRTDSVPGTSSRPVTGSPEQRQQDLNVFLNTHGPSGQVVSQLTDGIGHALTTAVDAGPHTVPLDGRAVRDHVVTEAKNLNNALTTAVHDVVRERAAGPDGTIPPTAKIDTIQKLRDAMSDPSVVDEVARRSAEQMVDNVVSSIGATHGTFDFRAGLSTIVQDAVKHQFSLDDGKFSPQVEQGFQNKTGSKRGYFTGPRVDVIGGEVAKHLKNGGEIESLVHHSGLGLDRDTVKQRLTDGVVPSSVSEVTKQNLVDVGPDQLKTTFHNALRGGADRLRRGLDADPVLKFVQSGERARLGDAAAQVIDDPHTVDRITFTPVTHEQADAFMEKVPDYATQAEIGAAIATDERRVKADFNTRENQLDPSNTTVESKTFENEYGRWGQGAVDGHTRQHPAGVFERHQQIGHALDTTIGDRLSRPDERSAKAILDQLIHESDQAGQDQHDTLRRKFDEVVKADPKNPRYRTGDTANPNTFGEHAQMVLNQYLRLTQGQNDNGRFVPRNALAKAILFHDMEKVNSKNQFGDGQGRHDQEPEHRGAVDQMNRHEGLWDTSRDFEIARAVVDADPFGFYFRPGKGLDVEGVHGFIKGLAHQVGSPRGGTPTAVDVRNLFDEFHEYYQADFSSYFSDSHFVHEQHGDVRSFGKSALSGLQTDADGKLVTTDGGRRFAYLDDPKGKSTKPSYEQKYRDLRARFDQDVAKEERERVVYVNDDSDTGVHHDSDRGVQAVRESNPNGKPSAVARVRKRDFTEDEKGAIDDALAHYAPIIGDQRAHSSRAGVEQEVQHIGAVNLGLERGELSYGMGGEYIASHRTVNLYAPATLSREFGGGRRGLEGTVTHELSHGLLKYALDDYGKHVGSWNEDGSPNRGPGAEPPSDGKARSAQADFKAAIKSHLLGRAGLEQKAPRRAEFVAQLEQQHPEVFARQENELSGPRSERIYQAVKDRQGDFNEHSGYWDRDGFPSFTGERPITQYGATNVNEDMAETAKYYFLDPDGLRAQAPHRAEFFDRLVAGWKKPGEDTVLVADPATDTEPDDRPLRDRLPEYARDGQALGALVPVDVQGSRDVGTTIERLIHNLDPGRVNPPKPVGIDAITGTLDGPGFESFLGQGRRSMVRVGEKWYEVHVKAEPDLASVGADQVTKQPQPSTGDVNDQNQVTHAQPQTDSTTGTVGTSYFGLFPAGPYASVGATGQLALPSAEHTSTVTSTEQRVIRSAGDNDRADVPVKYTVTVTDQSGGLTGATVDGRVSLLVSQDLANLKPHVAPEVQAPPKPDWSEQIEFLTPEAVVLDEHALFKQVSGLLHPSVTKFGAPGRDALGEFVSRGGIRSVLGSALQGSPVVSNDLLSPHGTHRDAVQLQARPTEVELLGVVPGDSELRFNDSSVNGGSTAANSKSGLDVNGIFGGGATVPGAVGGVGGVSVSGSAKVTQTSTSGTSVTAKSTVNAKGDVGLYKVKVDVDVTTASGEKATVEATAYVRMGLPEAKAQGLPVPEGTKDKFTDVGRRYEPPYLASAVAAGQARPGSFSAAAKVQPQVENALRDRPGFAKFLPRWDKFQRDPNRSSRDVAERLANLRKLTSAFSPAALKSKMDSLVGPGVSVQLKRRGLFTDEYINVTVKAKLGPGRHLGQATGRSVKGSVATSPALNSSTTTEKGWSVGLEGRVIVPVSTAVTSLGISPTVTPVQYSDATTRKNTGGPTVTTTTSAGGSPDAQVFQHDVEFEVEVTSYTRNRPWVKRLTPGSPFRVTPTVSTVAKTGDPGRTSLPKISGQLDLWVNDGSALKKDPTEFAPGRSGTVALTPSETPRIDELTGSRQPNQPKFLHVEAVANTEVLRDEALRQLQRAAGGDGVLGLPGGEARKRVDRMFAPETFRSGLPRLLSQGVRSGGFRYERRVANRVGGLGMGLGLSNPKLVVTSDAGGSDTTYAGGGKAGYEKSRKQAVEANAQLGLTVRPDGSDTHGQGQLYGSLKWSPWTRTSGGSRELSASVDHVNRAPSGSRTVLVQYDADVRLVAESRQESLVNGSTSRSGADVKLPGAVFVRMTEDQAREQGLLPPLEPRTAPPGDLTSPALVGAQSSSLGAAVVEDAPDLSRLIRDARAQLGRTGDKLLPKSVLDDSMNNLQRSLDLTTPESITSLVDGALDGGVPLVLHDAGIVSTDSYQVLLRASVTSSEFLDVVHDGGEVDHVVNTGGTAKENSGHGSSYGGQFRGAGRGLFQSNPSKVSGYDGAYAGITGSKSKTDQTVTTDTKTTARTASAGGPAVRHRHDVRFELVVQRGGRTYPIVHQDTRLTVRSSADDQKISFENQPARPAYAPRTSELTPAQSTPERIGEWQRQGTGPLPPSALTEGLRGAGAVRAGAVRALRLAGAGDGLTGPGTGAHNTLVSSVTNEMLQGNLPGMLSGPLDAPELHESAVLKNGHGSVKVYARLVNPDLTGLSDSVKLEHSDQSSSTFTGEAKQTVSGENQYNLGNGGLTDPDKNSHSWGGVDGRSPVGISDATSSAAGGQRSVTDKPKGRTGLVGFDVEYRVVADLGHGRTAAVEVRVPASTLVRMSDADLERLLGEALPDDLTRAQDAVKDAATGWRTAEEAVETAQREADDRWLDQRDDEKNLAKGAGDLKVDVATDPARELRRALSDAEHDAREAGRELRDGNAEITRRQDRAGQALAMAAATDEGSPERQSLLDQVTRAEQRIQDIRDAQPALVRRRSEAQDRAARLAGVLDEYRNDHSDHTARRDSALEEVRQARAKADEARQKWWNAKQRADQQLGAHRWPRPASALDPNSRPPRPVIRRKPVPSSATTVRQSPTPLPVIPRKAVPTSPQPSTAAGPSIEPNRDGIVEARDTGPATVSGWDASSGRPYDFDVSEIELRPVTDQSGRVVAVSFLPASEQTSGVERDWVTTNSGTVSSLDQGVTPKGFDPQLRQAREDGSTPDLGGRRFGEWASNSPAPWSTDAGDSFFVFAHGRPQSVKLTLLGGRTVRVDGAAFARIVAQSGPFVQAGRKSSVTLIACSTGRTEGPGGVAHDFQRALSELDGPTTVHAPTEPALFGRDTSTLGQAVGARGGFTAVTDGGHFRTFGESGEPTPTHPSPSPPAHTPVTGQPDDHVLTQDGTYESAPELVQDLHTAAADRGPAPAPLLGPDLFGLYRAPQPPEFLRGHDFSRLSAGQGLELLSVLDLAKGYQLGPEHTDPANLPDNREWTIETERADEKRSTWAPGDVEPLAQVTATPLLMHAIWLGGPLRDAGTMHAFRQNFGGAADRLHESIVPVLWTDVPRWQTDLAFTTEPPADGPDPLADVRDFVAWAREHGIGLVNIDEVFTSEHPMLLQEFYNSEAAKQAGPGYAAASDILRMELMHRFGGLYTDGDNVVHNLNDVILAARSDEGYATHRVGTKIANSAFTMSKGHPFARAYLDQQRENYGQTQKNLMPAAVNALGQEFFATPLGRVHRNSIMHRTGPEALSRTARRIGLPSAQHLPGMSEIRMNSDASWLKPPPAGESAPPSPDRGETLELTKRVVQTLVRGLYNREGDLHLTAVESVVERHPEPDLIWHAALSYLAADPTLAPLVRTVTDQRGYTGELHDVRLPAAARALLDIDPSRVHRNLGEVQRVATMRDPGTVLVSDEDTTIEAVAERLAHALVEAGERGPALAPIQVTGTGPEARVRAAEAAKELAGHLGRELGSERRELLARVPVKIRANEGPSAGVTVSFRPEHGAAVEVGLDRPPAVAPRPSVFHGLSSAVESESRSWSHEGRTIGAFYGPRALFARPESVVDSRPDFAEQVRANGFDLPLSVDPLDGETAPGVAYLVSGDHPVSAEDGRMLTELARSAELDWWYRPPSPSGPVRLEDREGTLKLLSGVLGRLRHSGPALDLTAVAEDVARHERPELVWTAVLELATASKTISGGTTHVVDRRLDPATGRWAQVELPEAARERFTVTGKATWRDGAVYRPVRLHAEPGRLRDLDEPPPGPWPRTDEPALARWVAESTVERMADGLPAPRVAVSGSPDRLVALIQAELTAVGATGVAAAELVTVAPGDEGVATISLPLTPPPATLSPASAAEAMGLGEEFTRLQLHGVTDTLLGKDNPAAVGALLDVAAEVARGADVGQAADAVEVLDRHGALDAALSAPGGRSLLLGHFRGILGRSDVEGYARDLATAIRRLAPGSLSPDVVREAVRGAMNGWRGDEVGENGTLEQRVERTRETLWLMRRFRVTNLAWLYRWRIAAAVRRYQEQEKAASAHQAAQLATLTGGGTGDDR